MIEYAMNTAGMTEEQIAAKHAEFAKADVPKTMTVRELLLDMGAAAERMSMTNPNRRLLARAGAAIVELARRAEGLPVQRIGASDPEEMVSAV